MKKISVMIIMMAGILMLEANQANAVNITIGSCVQDSNSSITYCASPFTYNVSVALNYSQNYTNTQANITVSAPPIPSTCMMNLDFNNLIQAYQNIQNNVTNATLPDGFTITSTTINFVNTTGSCNVNISIPIINFNPTIFPLSGNVTNFNNNSIPYCSANEIIAQCPPAVLSIPDGYYLIDNSTYNTLNGSQNMFNQCSADRSNLNESLSQCNVNYNHAVTSFCPLPRDQLMNAWAKLTDTDREYLQDFVAYTSNGGFITPFNFMLNKASPDATQQDKADILSVAQIDLSKFTDLGLAKEGIKAMLQVVGDNEVIYVNQTAYASLITPYCLSQAKELTSVVGSSYTNGQFWTIVWTICLIVAGSLVVLYFKLRSPLPRR